MCVLTAASETTSSQPTLAESAALQQAKHSHVELKHVEVLTGEEDESNVFQVTLYITIHTCSSPVVVVVMVVVMVSAARSMLHTFSRCPVTKMRQPSAFFRL